MNESLKYLPEFNISNKFTYFQQLMEVERGKAIASAALDQISATVSSLSDQADDGTLMTSLNLMKTVAESEREKELTVINNYKARLEKSGLAKDKRIKEALDKLNLTNFDNIDTFYLELTKAINLARQDLEKYKTKLHALTNEGRKQYYRELDYRFQIGKKAIQPLLKDLITNSSSGRDSYGNRINQMALKYFERNKSKVLKNITSGTDLAALISVIALDISAMIQEEIDKQGKGSFASLTGDEKSNEEKEKILNDLVDKYASQEKGYTTRLQRAIEKDSDDLRTILDNAKDILGIRIISEKEKKEKYLDVKRSNKKNSLYEALSKIVGSEFQEAFNQLLPRVAYTKNIGHGELNELIVSLLTDESLKVRGSAASDLIVEEIGSVTLLLESDESGAREKIRGLERDLGQAYTDYVVNRKKEIDGEVSASAERMNRRAHEAIKAIDETIGELNKASGEEAELFIYHESLKLYKDAGIGTFKYFHGRNLVILNYIDQMYSLFGLGGIVLPQRNAIELVARNLASLSIGSGYKDPVAKYFSIFAGLLMFDDVRNIALEALNTIQYENVKSIHLYNLNGIYVPASLVLTYTYEALVNASNVAASGLGAQTEIDTDDADKKIKEYLSKTHKEPSKPEDWAAMGSTVASGTTVKITFLASFLQFIEDLSNI